MPISIQHSFFIIIIHGRMTNKPSSRCCWAASVTIHCVGDAVEKQLADHTYLGYKMAEAKQCRLLAILRDQ